MGEEEGASIKLLSSRPESSRTQNGTQGDRRGRGESLASMPTQRPPRIENRERSFSFFFLFHFLPDRRLAKKNFSRVTAAEYWEENEMEKHVSFSFFWWISQCGGFSQKAK